MKPTIFSWFFLFLYAACLLFLSCSNDRKAAENADNSHYYTTDDDENNTIYDHIGSSEERQELVRKVNNLLVFHADDTMEVNKTYLASMALAKNANAETLTLKVLEASDAGNSNVIIDTTIVIGKRMKARLRDLSPTSSKNFKIEAISPDEQSLSAANKEAFWQWNIEPLKEGDHELKLSVEVIMSDEERVGLPARDIPVTIFAKKASFGNKLGNFFSNYWQWVITGIMVPILIAWFTTRLRHGADQRKGRKIRR